VAAGVLAAGAGAVLRKAVNDAGYEGTTSGERMRRQRGGSMRDVMRREWGYDTPPANATGDGPTGDSRPVTAQLTGSAEVNGETTVKVEVTVNPSSELITANASAKATAAQMRGMLNANGPGSTGRSSPDAAAPSPKGNTGGSSGSW
jgi:hypothetical protein